MVIWADYLASIATAFDTTTTEAGILFSLLFTIGLTVVVLIATRGRRPEVSVSAIAFFATLFFTVLGWYPIWLGSVMALVIALVVAKIISGA